MTPLVKVHYTGSLRRNRERLHGVKIQSRMVVDGKVVDYQTQIFFNESLIYIEAVPLDDGRAVAAPDQAKTATRKPRDWRRRLRNTLHIPIRAAG